VTTVLEALDERVGRLLASDTELMQEPYPLLNELRDTAPVRRLGNYVLVSSYAEADRALRTPRLFSNRSMEEGTARVEDARRGLTSERSAKYDEFVAMERNMTFMSDGDEHVRRRKTSAHLFVAPRIRELETLTESYTSELLDSISGRSTVNLEPLTALLPGWIIASLFGIPREHSRLLVEWGDAINLNLHRSAHIESAWDAMQRCNEYVSELAEAHRSGRAPSELLGTILDAAETGHENRLGSMFIEMQIGGYETTRGLLGNGVVMLMQNRDQWERLVADPGLAVNATDELLRMVTPALWTARIPVAETELAGVTVTPEDTIMVMLGAANRDPHMFERPDELDLSRANAKQHRALSVGPHYCMGQALARLEGAVFFRALATRFPDMELADGIPRRTGNANNPKLEELRVRLGADRGRSPAARAEA
jgi:cytochrome P450